MRCHADEDADHSYEESYQIRRPKYYGCPDRHEECVAYPRTGTRGWKVVIRIIFGCYPGGDGQLNKGEDDESTKYN